MEVRIGKERPENEPAGNGIDLIQPMTVDSDGNQSVRSILSISLKHKRALIELKVPGSTGNILQDLGPAPVEIALEGEIFGQNASTAIEEIYELYEQGKPVSFSSTMSIIGNLRNVTFENFQVNKPPGTNMHYTYTMQLKGTPIE